MARRRSLWRENRWALGINWRNKIPACWDVAFHNTKKLEEDSKRNKHCLSLGEKKLTENKRKISFGKVIAHKIDYSTDTSGELVVTKLQQTGEISSKSRHEEMISAPFMNKWIFGLLTIQGPWGRFGCGSQQSLNAIIGPEKITKRQLAKDMRAIWQRLICKKTAKFGYKSQVKVECEYCLMKRGGLSGAWLNTGKTFLIAPRFRKYLITIIQDPVTAAIVIQMHARGMLARKHYLQQLKTTHKLAAPASPPPPPPPPPPSSDPPSDSGSPSSR